LSASRCRVYPIQATTILSFKFADGVLVAGDRRATAGNTIMYDRADKVLEIDRHSLMAIAGVPATAWEMARVLEHSFHYFRRTQLAEMISRERSGRCRSSCAITLDSSAGCVGVVVPIFATYAMPQRIYPRLFLRSDGSAVRGRRIFITATGSGSPAVRAYCTTRMPTQTTVAEIEGQRSVLLALRALDTAAESDSATGVSIATPGFPIVKIISKDGITTLPEARLAKMYRGNFIGLTHHARRAIPLGRSDRQSPGIHRGSTRARQSDCGPELS
jgi:proteasome beta subunit